MTYQSEIERIATAVHRGADLYGVVAESEWVTDPGCFGSVLCSTEHPDEYARLADPDMDAEEWEACAPHVAFFAMCADVRERLHT
jgi:hypothetical protein